MRKIVLAGLVMCCMLMGCNRSIVDTTYRFKYADITGVGTVEVASWLDFENSDMMQVKASDGTVYLTHSSNVVLRTQ